MNDFREFSEQYNDYICHAASTGHTTKKGDKNLISTEDPKEPPKHYAYRLAQSGWSIDQVKKLCERSSNAYDSPANHKYWAEVLRIFKENYVQHSCNDFREFSEQYNDYLMHFGILGMKWGVRRYQNPDGTLTDAGKKRYSKERTKDIQNVVKNTKAYSKERYDAINEIIGRHSKNNMPSEEELKAKKKYEDSLEPLKKSYHDKKEYNKACDLLASTMAKIYYPGDKESPYRYKAGLAFDDLDQSGEITMAYLMNQGKSKKEIINIMKNAYKAQDEYYNHIKDRCDKILNDLGDIGDMQVGSQSYDKARYEIQHAVEDKGNYDGYNPYIAYLTDTSYSMGILNEMEKVYNNKEVTKMPEVSCHIYPAKFLDYKPGDYFEEYDKLMKNIK